LQCALHAMLARRARRPPQPPHDPLAPLKPPWARRRPQPLAWPPSSPPSWTP
jgi:hypothetical protein